MKKKQIKCSQSGFRQLVLDGRQNGPKTSVSCPNLTFSNSRWAGLKRIFTARRGNYIQVSSKQKGSKGGKKWAIEWSKEGGQAWCGGMSDEGFRSRNQQQASSSQLSKFSFGSGNISNLGVDVSYSVSVSKTTWPLCLSTCWSKMSSRPPSACEFHLLVGNKKRAHGCHRDLNISTSPNKLSPFEQKKSAGADTIWRSGDGRVSHGQHQWRGQSGRVHLQRESPPVRDIRAALMGCTSFELHSTLTLLGGHEGRSTWRLGDAGSGIRVALRGPQWQVVALPDKHHGGIRRVREWMQTSRGGCQPAEPHCKSSDRQTHRSLF